VTFYEAGQIRVTSAGIDMPGVIIPISAVATVNINRGRLRNRRFWWACLLIVIGLQATLFSVLAVALDNDPWASFRRACFAAVALTIGVAFVMRPRGHVVEIHTTSGGWVATHFDRREDAILLYRAIGAALTAAGYSGPRVQFGPINVLQVHARDLRAIRQARL
jgi:4-amino-4-deoxy-L-arabinose transferase-like glycosyltransferase